MTSNRRNRPIIVPGQRWRSLDPRDDGLIATVLQIGPGRIQIQRFRKTWVARDRFYRFYEKVADV